MTHYKGIEGRDIMGMDDAGNYYCRHVEAMTAEKLHSKADIAAELGYRDMEIDRLQSIVEHAAEGASNLAYTITKQAERMDHLTAELSDLRMSHSRLVSACKNLTGSLWPQNETTEKLREIIGELEGE